MAKRLFSDEDTNENVKKICLELNEEIENEIHKTSFYHEIVTNPLIYVTKLHTIIQVNKSPENDENQNRDKEDDNSSTSSTLTEILRSKKKQDRNVVVHSDKKKNLQQNIVATPFEEKLQEARRLFPMAWSSISNQASFYADNSSSYTSYLSLEAEARIKINKLLWNDLIDVRKTILILDAIYTYDAMILEDCFAVVNRAFDYVMKSDKSLLKYIAVAIYFKCFTTRAFSNFKIDLNQLLTVSGLSFNEDIVQYWKTITLIDELDLFQQQNVTVKNYEDIYLSNVKKDYKVNAMLSYIKKRLLLNPKLINLRLSKFSAIVIYSALIADDKPGMVSSILKKKHPIKNLITELKEANTFLALNTTIENVFGMYKHSMYFSCYGEISFTEAVYKEKIKPFKTAVKKKK